MPLIRAMPRKPAAAPMALPSSEPRAGADLDLGRPRSGTILIEYSPEIRCSQLLEDDVTGFRSRQATPQPARETARNGISPPRMLDDLQQSLLGDQSRMTMLSPGPPSRTSRPAAADQHVVTGAADEGVVAGPADDDVVTIAAVRRELDRPAASPEASITSSPAKAVDDEPVVAARARDVDWRRGRDTDTCRRRRRRRRTSSPLVPSMMTVSAGRRRLPPTAARSMFTSVTSVPVRSLTGWCRRRRAR